MNEACYNEDMNYNKNHGEVFSTYNPIINFVFYIGAIVFGMVFVHPVFLLCSVLLSFAYYFTIRGIRAIRLMLGMILVFVILSLVNPIFNPQGDTVLFMLFGSRPYTLEALYYGMALAAMFVAIIVWFASYSAVMTSDKFIYIFGRAAPSISLTITMVLRLIPSFQKKTLQISAARKSIGKAGDSGTKREKAENGMTIISALTSWALEGGIITADSMRSRGYGCGRRTNFSVYRFGGRDKLLLALLTILIVVIAICGGNGAMSAAYTPEMTITGAENSFYVIGMIAYFVFLIIPTALNILEEIKWRILRSRI